MFDLIDGYPNGGIYQIVNAITKEAYVGCTKSFSDRKKTHFAKLIYNCHHNKNLQASFNEYGKETFEFHIIQPMQSMKNIVMTELFWIKVLNPPFNIDLGGGGRAGVPTSDKTKEKLRQFNLGKKQSKETIEKRTKTHKLKYPPKDKILTRQNYVLLYRPNSLNANKNGRVLEHRHIISEKLNRKLDKKEQIHHKDLNPRNNSIENLMLFINASQHNKFHRLIYDYIVEVYGVNEIERYAKWFKEKNKDVENVYNFKKESK